jgi:predicted acetyltransferase
MEGAILCRWGPFQRRQTKGKLILNQAEIVVRKAEQEDRLPLYRMLELYQHDLSDIWDQDLDRHGEYGYSLDRFWRDKDCHPFLVLVDGKYAGFALVDSSVKIGESGQWMDQFFVMKKYRASGVGKTLAKQVFAALPGKWEVGQMANNMAAQAFWRTVIEQETGGHFSEHILTEGWWQGKVQAFQVR